MDRITTVRSPGLVHFYDVLWNVYRFLGTPTIQRDNLAQCIQLTLLKQAFDEEEDTSRRKELSECTVDPISLQLGTSTFSGVAVCAEFKTGQPFRFIHYSSQAKEVSLLLVKGNLGGLGQSLTESFFEMIGISSYQTLKLPTSLLSSQLELYLEGLVPYAPTRDLEPFIHNAVGKLNVTVAAEAPVAPNLKSLDIGVPATDVWTWLSSSPQQGKFLARLTQCLQSMTGMKLDLGSSRGAIDDREVLMAISEVSCGAFKLTREGRFTLKKGPVSFADTAQTKHAIEVLHGRLLEAILNAANDGG